MIQLHKYLPIAGIEEGYILSGAGDITWGYELFLPDIFLKNEEHSIDFHRDMNNVFTDLPLHTTAHFQSFVYSEEYQADITGEETFTVKYDKLRFNGNRIQKCRTFLYITIPSSKKDKFSGTIDYLIKKPFSNIETVLRIAKSKTDSFTNALNSKASVGLVVKRLTNQELERNIRAAIKAEPNLDAILIPDDIFPKEKEGNSFYTKIGNDYVSVITQKEEGFHNMIQHKPTLLDYADVQEFDSSNPNFKNPLSFSYPLTLGLQFSHIYNLIFTIDDIEEISRQLNKNLGYYNLLAALKYKPAELKKEQIDRYLTFCATEKEVPVRFTSNIIVKDVDLTKLQKKENLVSQCYLNLNGSIAKPSWINTFGKFIRSVPGVARYQDELMVSYLYSVSCYFPKENHYTSDKEGYIFQDRFGNPIKVNLINSECQTNSNFVIFGPSGSGKSFFVNSIVSQTLSFGDLVVMIDVGASYKRIGNINNAYYVDTTNINDISFNIFDCGKDKFGKYNYRDDGAFQVVFIETVLNYLWYKDKEISPEKETINKRFLKTLITQFYEYVNDYSVIPTFDEFFLFIDKFFEVEENKYLEEFINKKHFKISLEDYTTIKNGTYQHLLNATSAREINAGFVIYDLKGLEKDPNLKDLVFLLILNRVQHRFDKEKNRRKLLVIDEAIDSLKGNSGEFIGGMYRKIRKQNGRIGIATQGITYLDNIDPLVKQSIFGNSDVKILLSHKSNTQDYPILKEKLAISDYSISLLDNLQQNDAQLWREVFIQVGAYPKVVRYGVSEITALAYSTTPKNIIEIDHEYTKTKNYEAAIYNVLRRRHAGA